jgi:hypothetical protein
LGRLGNWRNGKRDDPERRKLRARIALSPICVDRFKHSADAAANMTEFKKVNSWQQGSFIEKGGWTTMPNGDPASSGVAQACATMLGSLDK